MRFAKWLAKGVLKLLGWKIINVTPPEALHKGVLIVAPHTSNWDFLYGMLFKFTHPLIPIRFAIKKEVMFFPLAFLMKGLGAIPIDRNRQGGRRHHVVEGMIQMIKTAPSLLLAIAPEGTRSYVKRWKTGFYRVALGAKVPIVFGYINYAKQEMGLGPLFNPTGNLEKDLEAIYAFYRTMKGKYPEKGVR